MLPHAGAVNAGPIVMHRQLMGLARTHHVTLATFAGPLSADQEGMRTLRDHGIQVHALWRDTMSGGALWKRRVEIARFGLSGRLKWLRGSVPFRTLQFWEPEMQALLDRLLSLHKYDMIQVEDNAMGAYNYPGNTPRVLTEHEVQPAVWSGHVLRNRKERPQFREARRWRAYLPAVWQKFDRIQVFTEEDRDQAALIAPKVVDKLRVNPFGVEVPIHLGTGNAEHHTIVFVGGFKHPPNVDAALWLGGEIMPLLRKSNPDARLLVVGSYPPKSVRDLACTDITVTGTVEDVLPYLMRATVVVSPLRQGGGMRMKVLQAMALGKAVVATRISAYGLAEPLNRVPLSLADTSDSFANAVTFLLRSPDERLELGLAAREFVRTHHSWEAYYERLALIHEEVLRERA